MKRNKRSFTFLELLLVLILLGLAASVIGWNISAMRRQETFKSAVHHVLDRLRICEQLILMGHDVSCRLSFTELNRLKVEVISMHSLTPALRDALKRGEFVPDIDRFAFQGMEYKRGDATPLCLDFFAYGHLISSGILELGNGSWDLKQTIVIPPFPVLLKIGENPPYLRPKDDLSQQLYPYEVLQKS